ncbi:MAG: hypothetical protein ACFCVD_03795 [Nodosilinea sp.]
MAPNPRQSTSAHYRQQHPSPPAYVHGPTAVKRRVPQPQVISHGRGPHSGRLLVAGGSLSVLALAAVFITPNLTEAPAPAVARHDCVKQVELNSFLSRDTLSKLLAVGLDAPKEDVRQILGEPYCVLAEAPTEAGAEAEREAYPLEFDPQTWLVVLYSNGQYKGYDFSFR